MTLVSIILATKDRADFLPNSIRAVLAQTDPRWELVILDNGTSVEHLMPADPRVRYFHEEASGSADAFAKALAHAVGDFVTPVADDDEIAPNTVETIVNRIGDHEWGYARTAYVRDGRMLFFLGDPWDLPRFRSFFYLGGAVFWRKRLSDRLGGFDPAFNLCGDYDLYLRFGEDSEPVFVSDQVLYVYHDHPGTETRVHGAEQQAKVASIWARNA